MLGEYEKQQVRELELYIDNDTRFAIWSPEGYGKAIRLALAKKWNRKAFDPFLALKVLERLAVAGAKGYTKDHEQIIKWSVLFTPTIRKQWAARELGQLMADWLERSEAY